MTGMDVRLSDEQVDLVHRLQRGKFGDVNFNEYEVPANTGPPFTDSHSRTICTLVFLHFYDKP